jgi:hypothetical protein
MADSEKLNKGLVGGLLSRTLGEIQRQQSSAILESIRQTQRGQFDRLLWGSPTPHRTSTQEIEPHRDGDVQNGVEGAFYGYKGGRPRKWDLSPSVWTEKRQAEVEATARQGVADGLSDGEICIECGMPDTWKHRQFIKRYRASLPQEPRNLS